ncbi:hypothetical protein RMR21_009655 [Agrobacterium sp. rho-8.1]|nr:hypothetical protein [Agrobacterium sp. rho-8.1]
MSQPKPIAVYISPQVPSFKIGFYKLKQDDPTSNDKIYLYDNGDVCNHETRHTRHVSGNSRHVQNHGPIHPDDWYWNENEKRLKEMSTLPEEEYLAVTMSDAIRFTISEWDELAYSKALIAQRQAEEKLNWQRALLLKQMDQEALILEITSRMDRP